MAKQTGAGARMSQYLEVSLAQKKVSKDIIDAIKLAMLHSDCDPYAQSYAQHMTTSFDEFEVDGVKTQVLYMLNNMKQWKGDDARNAKQLLKQWTRSK